MAYGALISMNVTSKNKVDFILHEPWFEHDSHGLTLHEVITVTVVPWRMHENNQPWCFTSVHLWELVKQPLVLRCVHTVSRVGRQYNDVSGSSFD